MTDPVLLGCPFCGGEALDPQRGTLAQNIWFVSCRNCDVRRSGSVGRNPELGKQHAIAAWNRRSHQSAEPATEWRCFHCDEVFKEERAAAEHFGRDETCEAACRIKMGAERSLLTALRRAERDAADAWAAIQNETTDAAKAYFAQAARHQEQIRVVEELGYERGLADGRSLSISSAGWQDISSAPKDGTEVLLWGAGVLEADGRQYARGRHVGWWHEGAWKTRDPFVYCLADAWMPLPLPPPSGTGEPGK